MRKSKQLPFRFLSAYKSIADIAGSRAFDALENALEASVANMPRIPGNTIIAVDVSGSMDGLVSGKSSVRCVEIGMTLGLIANQICDSAVFYTFNETIRKIAVSHRSGILRDALNAKAGGDTNMYLPFETALRDEAKADRLIILSDNECNAGGGWRRDEPVQAIADEYRRKSGRDIWVHAIDLQGYGTQQFYGALTNIIAGWSEKLFPFILLAEQGEGTLIQTIENYAFSSDA